MQPIGSEDEGSQSSHVEDHKVIDEDRSVFSKAESSVHLGLGGFGGGFAGFGGGDDSSANDESEDNSIYTETDLAQSTYAMSVRTYEKAYLNKNPSVLSKQGAGNQSNTS